LRQQLLQSLLRRLQHRLLLLLFGHQLLPRLLKLLLLAGLQLLRQLWLFVWQQHRAEGP
jgi:hypothetical protein